MAHHTALSLTSSPDVTATALRTCQSAVSLQQYLVEAATRLRQAGIDSPRLCAQLLLCHLLKIDRLRCTLETERELTSAQVKAVNLLVNRKIKGEPLAYLIGYKEFFSRNFSVTPDTLIPRPDTELLVATALELLPASPLTFADVGAGSCCIGITLALERTSWHGVLFDLNPRTVAVAQANAHRLKATSRLAFVQADMRLAPLRACAYDLVVSNPTYIAECERSQIMDGVLHFEPHMALFSSENGIACLKVVVALAAPALKTGGLLLLEHGAKQGAKVRRLLDESFVFGGSCTRKDLAGLERCTLAWKH